MTSAGLFDVGTVPTVDAKTCTYCRTVKPRSEFNRNVGFADGLAQQCRNCVQSIKLTHYYGLDSDKYDALLAEQDGCCAVCKVPAAECRIALVVDHDHNCCPTRRTCGACIRGLICDPCNRAIGLMRDSTERLRSAADYLARYELVGQSRGRLA